ncbi:MAG: double zinc ribbon domain-containing protein [Pseudomonadota bacterium]
MTSPTRTPAPLLERLLDLLAPRRCLVCGLVLPPPNGGELGQVCEPCTHELPWNVAACGLCAAPVASREEVAACLACELAPPQWDRAVAALRYAPPVDAMIQRLKFQGRLGEGECLASALALALVDASAAEYSWPALITAVPMHPLRRARRGFNHAAFIADTLARALPSPIQTDFRSLRRTRWTPAQATLDRAARHANLVDGVRWHGPPPPAHVAVVDDVLTTGATAAAVTRALRQAGAEEVEIWACARAGHTGAAALS